MSAKVQCLVRVEDGVAWRLEPGKRYGLGRDIGNHFVVDSSSVANRHLELWVENGQVVLEDSGLAPRTLVDGEVLDGEIRRVRLPVSFETGRVRWRLAVDEPGADEVRSFRIETARQRLIEGAKQKLPYRRWTRGWKDLHGRPLAGILGVEGGAFWFRVFAHELQWDDDPVEVYSALADQDLTAPMTSAEARATLGQLYIDRAADAPIVFALSEMFGPSAALNMLRFPRERMMRWLGPLCADDAEQVIARLTDSDQIMAVARNAQIPVSGIRRIRQLHPGWNWPVERLLLETALEPETLLALTVELQLPLSSALVTRLMEHGSDDLAVRLHAAVAAGQTPATARALSQRPVPKFAAALLRREVASMDIDRPRMPLTRDLVDFCESGGSVAALSLIEVFEEMPEHVAEVFAMMSDAHLQELWGELPANVRDAITQRYGRPTADLPELPADRLTPWMLRWAHKDASSEWHTYYEGGPRIATRDGYRLPMPVERGLYCALYDTEFSYSNLYFDELLLDLRTDIEPRSAMRSLWWQLSCGEDIHRRSPRILYAGSCLMATENDIAEVARNAEDIGYELMVSAAPIAPMLLWVRGWQDRKRVPDAALPPPEWADDLDPHDPAFELWPEGALEEVMQRVRTPLPDYFEMPPDLTKSDWSQFTDWMIEHLPASLPQAADYVARTWLRANAADRILYELDRWLWLITDTWVRDFRDQLIWIADYGDERVAFRPDGGDFVDVDTELVELADGAKVHLAHPMDLDQRARNDWAQHLADHQILSLFDQLDTTRMRDAPSLESVLGKEAKWWAMDTWWRDFHIEFSEKNFEFTRDFGTRGRAIAEVRERALAGLRFENRCGEEVELDALDPVVLSQTVADFEHAHAKYAR